MVVVVNWMGMCQDRGAISLSSVNGSYLSYIFQPSVVRPVV